MQEPKGNLLLIQTAHDHIRGAPESRQLIQSRCHVILPFCHFSIKASRAALRLRKLTQKGFTLAPQTLGQHLRSRRLVLKLTQEEAAARLRTLREHYERWERDEVQPMASFWPRLIAFLGYYPGPEATPADLVLKARRVLGLSQFGFGRKVKVIAKDIRLWEHGNQVPSAAMQVQIEALARSPLVALAGL